MTADQHPTDRLIREMVDSGLAASEEEIAAIVARMASAPFSEQIVPIQRQYRGVNYQGRTLGRHEESLFLHLAVRVAYDEQWAMGTTEEEFVADLHAAVEAPDARLLLYRRRGGPIAATLTPNNLPLHRRGSKPGNFIFVVYSADRSRIISGYGASGVETISIPGDARWLR